MITRAFRRAGAAVLIVVGIGTATFLISRSSRGPFDVIFTPTGDDLHVSFQDSSEEVRRFNVLIQGGRHGLASEQQERLTTAPTNCGPAVVEIVNASVRPYQFRLNVAGNVIETDGWDFLLNGVRYSPGATASTDAK